MRRYLSENVIDVTLYTEIQDLLCVSDLFVTDYSSSMFDYALLRKPCVLFVKDYKKYDRGFYFSLQELPFPKATEEFELLTILKNFKLSDYQNSIDDFYNKKIISFENGKACEALYFWLVDNKNGK